MTDKAIEALDILQTDFCMGVDNRSISDDGILKELEIIRDELTQPAVDVERLKREVLKELRNRWGVSNDCAVNVEVAIEIIENMGLLRGAVPEGESDGP